MSVRLGKMGLVIVVALLGWMTISAFSPKPDPAADLESPGSVATQSEPISLSPEDLALLRKVPAESQAVATEVVPPATVNIVPDESAPSKATAATAADRPSPQTATTQPAESATASDTQSQSTTPAGHSMHRSKQGQQAAAAPKRRSIDPEASLPSDGAGRVLLDWDVLATTIVDEDFRPTFMKNLGNVDGKSIALTGFMSPLDEVGQMTSFMLVEYPAGCFYCQTPDPTGIAFVELAPGRQEPLSYNLVKITGTLHLNRDDPEDFLYIITNARVSLAD